MVEFKGSESEKNLLKAFSGESLARNKYTFYAIQAKKEGYDIVAKAFEEAANNEKEHAKVWFRWLNNREIPHTKDNLIDAIKGESFEESTMYKEFAAKAREEGFDNLADLFKYVADIEKAHKEKFEKLYAYVNDNAKPNAQGNFIWECSACGATFEQKETPDYCPLCENEDIFFFKKEI